MPYGLWIRVEAHEVQSPLIARLAEALGLKPVHAFGHFVALAGQVAEHTGHGLIKDVPDAALEQWAAWHGRKGKFAAAVRQHVQDPDTGEFIGWHERMGQLIAHRELDAERKREHRRRSGKNASPHQKPSDDGPRTVLGRSAPTELHGTKRDESPDSGNGAAHSELLPEAVDVFMKRYFGEDSARRCNDVLRQFRASLQPNGAVIKRGQRAVAVDSTHLARAIGCVLRADPQPRNPGAAVVWVLRELERTRLEYLSEKLREPGERSRGEVARVGSILFNSGLAAAVAARV